MDEMSLPALPPPGYLWEFNKLTRVWSLATITNSEPVLTNSDSAEVEVALASCIGSDTASETATSQTQPSSSPAPPSSPPPPLPPPTQQYIEHIVMADNTIQGISLMYNVPIPSIKKLNHFSGNTLALAPSSLLIPLDPNSKKRINRQDVNSKDFKTQSLMVRTQNRLTWAECQFYLEDNDLDLQKATENALGDLTWEAEQEAMNAGRQAVILNEQEQEKKKKKVKKKFVLDLPDAKCMPVEIEMAVVSLDN